VILEGSVVLVLDDDGLLRNVLGGLLGAAREGVRERRRKGGKA